MEIKASGFKLRANAPKGSKRFPIRSASLMPITMTSLQKTFIAATVAVLAGAGIYENRQVAKLRDQVQTLRQEQAPLTEQIRRLQDAAAEATIRLSNLSAENARLKSAPHETKPLKPAAVDPAESYATSLRQNVDLLKRRWRETPDAQIPEFQLLTEEDWTEAASGNLNTEANFRHAMSKLRGAAEGRFASFLDQALRKYSKANGNKFPSSLSQLLPYRDASATDAMFQRWTITPIPPLGGGTFEPDKQLVITQKAVADDVFDRKIMVGLDFFRTVPSYSTYFPAVAAVKAAFSAANGGQDSTHVSQLLPYAKTPEQQVAVQKWMLFQEGSK